MVENAPLPVKGERLFWDTEIPGFGLRVTAAGARSYLVQRRVKGKNRRVTLGRHGILTAETARKRAIIKLGQMADGVDPVKERKKEEALGVTLRDVKNLYIEDRRTKSGLKLKNSTIRDIDKHVSKSFAEWADKPVITIRRDMVATKYRALSERSNAQASQAMRILRALLNFARAAYRGPDGEAILPENPVLVLSESKSWSSTRARNTYIQPDKVGSWWSALHYIRIDPALTKAGRTSADILAFLLLTGLRWSEASELTWKFVDLNEGTIRLPDPKNRNPVTFPLSSLSLSILKNRPMSSDYVFPSRINKGKVYDVRSTLRKLEVETSIKVTPHDLRRTFRAIAGLCGIELWKTKLLMNHTLSGDVTITNYTDTENLHYLRSEINAISEWVEDKAKSAKDQKKQIGTY